MSKRGSSSSSSSQRSGPPPLREKVTTGPPKARKRASLREIIKTLRNPTIGTLRRELGHYLIYGLFAFVIIFAAGAFFSFGDQALRRRNEDLEGSGEKFPVVAKVGNQEFTREEFDDLAQRAGLLRDETLTYRQDWLGKMVDEWIDNQLLDAAAKQRGLSVSSADVDAKLDEMVENTIESEKRGLSERDWAYKLEKQGSSAAKRRRELRDQYEAGVADIRGQLLRDKLKEAVESEVAVTDQDLQNKYDEITTARVILLRVNPPKPAEPAEGTTEDEAAKKAREDQVAAHQKALDARKAEAEKLLKEVRANAAKFAKLAEEHSDDYTAGEGGKIGPFTRDNARFGDAFKEAVFKLEIGRISDLIQVDEGWLIVVVDEQKKWPDDYRTGDPRSLDEAKQLADKLYQRLTKDKADFAALAKEYSDDPGSKDNGGKYDYTGRGQWVKPFEKMAFALETDEIGKPVRTSYGYHIIQVLGRKPYPEGEKPPAEDEPKDADLTDDEKAEKRANEGVYPEHKDLVPAQEVEVRHILIRGEDVEKKIADKRQQLEDETKSEHYNAFLTDLRDNGLKTGRVEVIDPQMKAYLAGKDTPRDDAAVQLNLARAAAAFPHEHAEVHYQLAQTLGRQRPSGDEQVAAVKALAAMGPDVAPQLLKALDEADPMARKAIVEALGDLNAKDAAPKLQELYPTEVDQATADAIKSTLEKLGASVPKRDASAAGPTTGLELTPPIQP